MFSLLDKLSLATLRVTAVGVRVVHIFFGCSGLGPKRAACSQCRPASTISLFFDAAKVSQYLYKGRPSVLFG